MCNPEFYREFRVPMTNAPDPWTVQLDLVRADKWRDTGSYRLGKGSNNVLSEVTVNYLF